MAHGGEFVARRPLQIGDSRILAAIFSLVRRLASRPRLYVPLLALMAGAQAAAVGARSGPADYVGFGAAGRALLEGRFAHVYDTSWMQSGPLQLVLIGACSFLDQLSHNLGVLVLSCGVSAFCIGWMPAGVRWLRERSALPRAEWLELLVPLVALLINVTSGLATSGHPAEGFIPLQWVAAAYFARKDRPVVAALFLGTAWGWEPWGVLGAPLLLLARSRRTFVIAATVSLASATAIYLPFVLSGHFQLFHLRWQIAPGTLDHLLWPHARWFSWPMRMLQGLLALGVGAGITLALRRRGAGSLWLIFAAIVVARLVFDPTMLDYYWLELQTLLLVGMATTDLRRRELSIVLALLTFLQIYQTTQWLRMTLLPTAVGLAVLVWHHRRIPEPSTSEVLA